MDDVLTGGATYKEVTEVQQQLFELMKRGQFLLRKWRSNEAQILQHLDQNTDALLTLDKEAAKTLGLLWDSSKDVLQYKLESIAQDKNTKRTVLSRISQVFDPLGLIGPVLIKGKCFMQKLWTEELQWDQPLPDPLLSAWNQYCDSMPEINTLQITRNVNPEKNDDKVDLFGFSDASQSAFGACIYMYRQFGQAKQYKLSPSLQQVKSDTIEDDFNTTFGTRSCLVTVSATRSSQNSVDQQNP